MTRQLSLPLVLVEGFLSSTSQFFWGKFEDHLNRGSVRRRIIFASVGPVSSLHDRACELYYALKGGPVDYGEQHSIEFKHSRYGKVYEEGLYPAWSKDNPLHFLGHSIGGSTIVKLIALITQGFFGPDAHPDMILSVTAVSAPFRGTQLVYSLGESVKAAPAVRPFSFGSILTKSVHILAFFSPLIPLPFDLHAESRSLTYRDTSFSQLLSQLWKSDWAEGKDAAPYDVTFEAADERDSKGEGVCSRNTFYQSYTATMTQKGHPNSNQHSTPFALLISPFYITSRLISQFDFTTLRPIPSFFGRPQGEYSEKKFPGPSRGDLEGNIWAAGEEKYRANDGVVPLFSQWHPSDCSSAHCDHRPQSSTPVPGKWQVHHEPNRHHLSIIPLWYGSRTQIDFWQDLSGWLEKVEAAVSSL
ncbi:alpha/beta-hydrolase [Sistotremastrum suecicum HHB10207 ss-3]|uniref:Alpha/beta-hydrolase n=1 Tax=Sistotremastrum suecicum HHB10207 ss-3 TaxID=1314776 RepID=A0A166BP88_9AGAM|nr:alpha/beta-hydrolase [Sistotremastrum suecicum HHB10207 ss-3]